METEWVQDAVENEEVYLAKLLDESKNDIYYFGSKEADDAAYVQFRRRFPAMDIMKIDDASSNAERYALDREWRRRLGGGGSSSILTLLRRDALDASENRRLCLVPQNQWALIELARSREIYGIQSLRYTQNEYKRKMEKENVCLIKLDGNDRRLETATTVHAGDTLFTEKVQIVACYDPLRGFAEGACCFHCGRSSERNTLVQAACSNLIPSCCGLQCFSFCGSKCQRIYEKRHLAECKAVRYAIFDQDQVPAFKAILAIRAALLWSQGSEDSELLASLKSHSDDLASEYLAKFSTLANSLGPMINCDVNRLEFLLCCIDVNAIALGSGACGLAPKLAAVCNHSCLENATHFADWNLGPGEPRLVFRAVMPLSNGTEILISYLGESDLALPTENRRAILNASKHFVCCCERCTSTEIELAPGTDTDSIAEAHRLLENAKKLHPDRYAVAIAATAEHLGDTLALTTAHTEALASYELAISHLRICRGEEETQRILRKRDNLLSAQEGATVHHNSSRDIVFEIKTWESVSTEFLLKELAPRIRKLQPLQPEFYVYWHQKATTTTIGYGLSALILSCTVHSSTDTTTSRITEVETLLNSIDTIELDLSEALVTAFPDDIQSVDIGAASFSSPIAA